MKLVTCSFILPLLLISTVAYAQQEFGAIQGKVGDADGQAIPGATVTASSPSWIGGSAIAYTDQIGSYRFSALAPGTYEVKAELSGFQTVNRKEIRLFVGITLTVDFVLQPEAVSETVTVSGEPPLIDMTTTATSNIVPAEIVQNLPKPASIINLLPLTPGVGEDLVAYGGAQDPANRIWIDGVDVSSPQAGALYAEYNYNWIEEAQVTGIGAPAEYGGFSGVVGNFVTRSGGNQFHGLFETFFQNENLVSSNTPDPGPESPFKSFDATAQVGGPIKKDKIWFFSGFQYPYTQSRPFGYDGVVTDEYPKVLTKLTTRINENNTLQGFVHYNYARLDGDGAGALTLPEATTIGTCHEASWNATWISLLGSRTNLDARFGGFWANCKDNPRNDHASGHIDLATGVTSVNAPYLQEVWRFRPQVNAALSHYADKFLGSHDFKFGVEFERSHAENVVTYGGPYLYYDYYSLSYIRYSSPGQHFDNENHRISSYAQDDWHLNERFSLSLGVRWDHNRGLTDRGVVFSTDPVAPRIGFIWKIKENGRSVLKAHYGDYYEALLASRYFRLSDRPLGWTTDCFDSESGEWVHCDEVSISSVLASNIKQPLMRQFTVGIDQELPGRIALGAHYVHRRWENLLQDTRPEAEFEPVPFVNPVTGQTIIVFNQTSPGTETTLLAEQPGLFRHYNGFEVIANRQFRNKLSLSASIVFSKITGNIPNDFSSVVGVSSFLDDPNSTINFNGHLVNDPTLAWKIVGTYSFRWGINAGWFLRHESGDTWTPIVKLPRSIVSQGGTIFGLPRGSYRLPSSTLLDLRLEKAFVMYRGELRFTADIFNVFNSAYVTAVDKNYGSPTYSTPLAITDPRSIRLGLRFTF